MNSVLRPLLGLALGAAIGWDTGTGSAIIMGILAGGAALPVSLGKGATTAGLTAVFPEPVSQVVRSVIEDASVVVIMLLALLAPIIAALAGIAAAVFGVLLFFTFRRAYRSLRRRFGASGPNRGDLAVLQAEAASAPTGAAAAHGGPIAALRRFARANR